MREIKFRGMTTNLVENEFVYGYYQKLIGYSEYDLGNIYHFIVNENDESNYVDEKTVGQFTGLKDKNGVEIYEGDLVEVTYYSYEQPECSSIFKVVYDGMSFNLDFVEGNYFENAYTEEWEVIGNIHDVSE